MERRMLLIILIVFLWSVFHCAFKIFLCFFFLDLLKQRWPMHFPSYSLWLWWQVIFFFFVQKSFFCFYSISSMYLSLLISSIRWSALCWTRINWSFFFCFAVIVSLCLFVISLLCVHSYIVLKCVSFSSCNLPKKSKSNDIKQTNKQTIFFKINY